MADAETEETPTQRQARLRREKRNAKIVSEGNDRLSKITQVSGRKAPAPEDATAARKPQGASVDDDPAEVDISEHHWTPESRQSALTAQQRQAQQDPFATMGGPPPGDGAQEDPMMRMMQQILGGAGGDPNNPNAGEMPQLPPVLQAMLNGQASSQKEAQTPKSNSQYIWRVVHAFFALALALYIALTSTFNGTKLSRAQSMDAGQGGGMNLFYLFATTQLVLQTSRFMVEKGQLGGSGWLATIANSGMVPEPWAGYIRIVGRYSIIWQTIVGDAMTVVFVLGLLAWSRGMTPA